MLKRFIILATTAASFALASPAYADGTGKGPTYNAPAPLTPQSYTIYPNQNGVVHHQSTHTPAVSHSGCNHSQVSHVSYSGLATNPRPVCYGHTQTVTTHTPVVHTQKQVIHTSTVQQPMMMIDTSSFTGGVGVGVNDVFVGGGGFFGGGAVGSAFGARASGAFAGRNVALSRSLSGFRGGSRAGSRRGSRGGRRGGGGKR